MEKVLRIGLIGCGDVTHVFTAPSIRAARNARMVIAMDPLPDVADKFEKAFEVPVTSRLEDVLDNGMVDAVVVSTPPSPACGNRDQGSARRKACHLRETPGGVAGTSR